MVTAQTPAHDKPPAGQGPKAGKSHHAGASKRSRVQESWIGLHVLGGGLARPFDVITSDCTIQATPALTGSWMQLYDVSPIDRAWMDRYLVGGRWSTYLVIAVGYITLAGAILKAHGTDIAEWFKPAPPAASSVGQGDIPQQPTGPAPQSGPVETPFGSMPAEGLPHDVELVVREFVRQHPEVSYEEARAAALQQMAEFTATQNGASGRTPRALGEVIG